mmetsp:Transcript_18922/g.54784  ORF Transcript_18922/g.54784 Transcript_18922/m.54784 type:complete len:434 (+) Transcript_18922:126-1427(+)
MVAAPEVFEEEGLLTPEAGVPPRRHGRGKAAMILAGGLAAAAIVAVGLSTTHSLRAAPTEAAAVNGVVSLHKADLAEKKPPKRKSRASFVEASMPFMGGRNGVLDGDEHGAIYIDEDGKKNKYYLPGAKIVENGSTIVYTPPLRFYLMNKPTTDYGNAENFYKPILPGKTFTCDIELSVAGCGCNINFYLVDMPAKSAGKDHDHYCDAQCFDGLGCCAEFDMNEGNANVQQVTNHACTRDYADHPDWQCHKWGDPEAKTQPHEFSPGVGQGIDGSKRFTFSQEFRVTDDQLEIITTMTQGSTKVVKTMGPNAQLQAMYKEGSLEKGMVFVTGYWSASDMNWLDGDECGGGSETCSNAPARISNFRITTNGDPVPSPSPQPSPQPSPAPQPQSMRCCYGDGCNSCQDPHSWCGESQGNCNQCNGAWRSCSTALR